MTDLSQGFDPAALLRKRARQRSAAMWIAITVSLAAVLVLLGTGRGDSAWSIGAAVLVLSCLAVCSWAAFSAQRDIDEVVEEAKRFVAQRQQEANRDAHAAPKSTVEGGPR